MGIFKEIYNDKNGIPFTAQTFLEQLRPSNSYWWKRDEKRSDWVFRGQWNSEWEIIPSAWRKFNNPLNELKNKLSKLNLPVSTSKDFNESDFDFLLHLNAECQAISDFYELANDLGFAVPNVPTNPLKNRTLYHRLEILSLQRTLYLCQHHGVPTRLVDWTKNPIFAIYFAIGREFRSKEIPSYISVFALNLEKKAYTLGFDYKDYGGIILSILTEENSKSNYINTQQGLFTIISSGRNEKALKEYYKENNGFPSMENLLKLIEKQKNVADPILLKFNLKIEQVNDLLLILDRENISQAHLMPTLDKVAETVKARWNY